MFVCIEVKDNLSDFDKSYIERIIKIIGGIFFKESIRIHRRNGKTIERYKKTSCILIDI